ncbi:hypothetical protein [Pedobacter sp. Leaf176]|uniref:hypothetical protein n=1 Tax=Pedobacter sp. Leaf176 TaxID=1736286 RepID=UPI0006FCA390|nr:hypothetical protein [Pedobacter sp. Leaf176]KQR65349.1 hypothetical protein ASF92_20685 [Pedobacter sp. Leaf176]
MTPTRISFEKWFERQYASMELCFLCGKTLTKDNSTKEHIFPQWILNKFDLWDKSITLLNGIRYDYKRSIIPCCNVCNNEHLSKLESIIKNGVEKGYQFFKENVPLIAIYQWCQLIFYKWLYKETFFKENVKDPHSEKIVRKENFESMSLNHLLLRSIDKRIKFENFFPGSIFICHLKTGQNASDNFDYLDAVPEQCIMLRLGEIGIVVMLADSEIQKYVFADQYRVYLSNILAPIQLKNLFIQCMYRQHLFNDPYSFELKDITDDSLTISQIPKENFTGDVYTEWLHTDYAILLNQVFGGGMHNYLVEKGIPSFLFDKDGNFKDRAFDSDGTILPNE